LQTALGSLFDAAGPGANDEQANRSWMKLTFDGNRRSTRD
jgi:hypothetical protein